MQEKNVHWCVMKSLCSSLIRISLRELLAQDNQPTRYRLLLFYLQTLCFIGVIINLDPLFWQNGQFFFHSSNHYFVILIDSFNLIPIIPNMTAALKVLNPRLSIGCRDCWQFQDMEEIVNYQASFACYWEHPRL